MARRRRVQAQTVGLRERLRADLVDKAAQWDVMLGRTDFTRQVAALDRGEEISVPGWKLRHLGVDVDVNGWYAVGADGTVRDASRRGDTWG